MTSIEPNRPLFHFTPPINWMNDPNGLVYSGGEYHLFYQHNPYAPAWGHMSWGHAVSDDLVHWRRLPIAICEEPDDGYTIFSGSAVLDALNTSGFARGGRPPLVAVYTADHQPAQPLEDIHIAYSLDQGRSFTKYGGNPVIDAANPKFGDPKAFWHEPTQRWILAAIHGIEQGCVHLYASPDLKTWQKLSEFHAPDTAPGIWECPDLFPVRNDADWPHPDIWVLKVNVVLPNRGPVVTRYFTGGFDGWHFQGDPLAPQALNPDHDRLYAEVTYNGLPAPEGSALDRRVLIGWIRQDPDPSRAWTGMQSIPREVSYRQTASGARMCHTPIAELAALRTHHHVLTHLPLSGVSRVLSNLPASDGALELAAEFTVPPSGEFGFQIHLAGHATARVGYSADSGELVFEQLDRRLAVPLLPTGDRLRLRLFIDRGVVEAFGGDGEATLTALVEPETACTGLDVYAEHGAESGDIYLDRLDRWELRPIWTSSEGQP